MKTSGKPDPKKPAKRPEPSRDAREEAIAALREKQAVQTDPLSRENLKTIGIRVGIPLLVGWVIAFILNGWIPKAIAGVITLALAGLALWALRFARRSRAVAQIVRGAETPAARKEAMAKLEADYGDDTSAAFAKAQLQLQDNELREALKTLEGINLSKVMEPVADQARAHRAMIHLMLGETDEARKLADLVDLSRHKEPQSRATMGAIIGEAWARTGQAKRAVELLETFDLTDAAYADLLPQMLRALAFAYAWASDTKKMRGTLRRLSQINVQYMSGFVTKKKHPSGVSPRGIHPLLEQEAFDIIRKSGMAPRKVEFRRS